MKQTFTSARRPLEILIHIIGWGIMFGFPFFFVERGNGNINWWAYVRPCRRTTFFYDRVLRQLFPVGSPLPFSESG